MKNIMRTVPGKIIIYVLTCVMMLTAIVSAGELAACFAAGLYERTPEDIIQAEVAEDTFNAAHIIIADVINQQIVSGKDIDESENNDLYMSTIYDPGNLAFCVTDEKGKVLRQSDGFDRSKAKYTYYLKANESKESKAETANEDVEIEVYSNDIKEPETMNADTGNGAALNDSEEPELETTNEDDENGTTLNDNEEPKWDATNLSGTKDDPDASYMTVKIYYEGNDGIPDNTRNGLKKKIYDNMYKYRNDAIPAGIISAVLSLVFFIMMLCVSARRPNSHELYPGYFNKVPYDVMLVAAVGAFGIFAAIIDTIGPDEIQIIAIGIAIIYLVIAFNALCMSAAARIKQGTLLKNTLIFIVCRWCFNLAKIIVKKYVAGVFKWFFALVSGMFSSIKEIFNKFPLIWKSAVIFGVIALVDLIIFAICWDWSTPELYLVYWFITRIVLFVIIVTSVFSIRNSFAISITEKLKTYGMLSSIGATKKQIRKMVLFEGFVLGLIGISIGILLGICVNILLVFIINTIGENANLFGDGFSIVYKFSMFPIILSIILSCVVIIISSLFCSYKASCVSPIQNIRNSDDIKSKKLRTPKFIRKLFGIGGVLSYKNLKRSKKKYRVTIFSLTISIFIYIIVSTFVEYTLNIIHEEYSTLNYNIQVSLSAKDYDNTKELQNNMIKKLETLDKAYTRYYMYFQDGDIDFENHITSSSIKHADDFVLYEMVLYNDNGFKEYLERLDLDYDEMKNKVIIINEIKDEFASKRNEYITLTDYKKGDLLTYKDKSVEVGAVVRDKAIGLENNYSNTLYLIGNYEHFPLKEAGEIVFNYMYFNSKEPYKFVKTLKDLSTNELYIYVDNLEEQASQTRSIMLILSIIVYGFILVVTFIGVTSVFNTINSNMELRSKDFASLKSIGMTKKEFNNMINLEAIFYSLKSLFYGIIFGLIGSFIVYKLINKNYIFDYQIPIKSIIIAIIFIIILIIIIMRYSIKKINKQNIIETIRNSNI